MERYAYSRNNKKIHISCFSEKAIGTIRKELAELIEYKQIFCETQAEKNNAVIEARSEINKKYGREWRGER